MRNLVSELVTIYEGWVTKFESFLNVDRMAFIIQVPSYKRGNEKFLKKKNLNNVISIHWQNELQTLLSLHLSIKINTIQNSQVIYTIYVFD